MIKNYKKSLSAGGIAKGNQGFTLIELLVVIAIIGVLAAVILSATNSARTKGDDAKIVSNIRTIATQSAIYYDDNAAFYSATGTNVYTSTITTLASCTPAGTIFGDPIVSRAITEIMNNNTGTIRCQWQSNGNPGKMVAWALVLPLKSQAGTYWCIDSVGTSRKTHANGTAYNAITGSAPAALTDNNDFTCN